MYNILKEKQFILILFKDFIFLIREQVISILHKTVFLEHNRIFSSFSDSLKKGNKNIIRE